MNASGLIAAVAAVLLTLIWPMPNTATLRDLLIVLLLVAVWVEAARSNLSIRSAGELRPPVYVLVALIFWFGLVALFFSDETLWSLGEISSQWLRALLAGAGGAGLGLVLARRPKHVAWVLTAMACALAAHVFHVDFFAAWKFLSEGELPRRIGGLPGSLDWLGFVIWMCCVFLFAELSVRHAAEIRVLRLNRPAIIAIIVAVLAGVYVAAGRNGAAVLLLLVVATVAVTVMAGEAESRRRALRVAGALAILLPIGITVLVKMDPRWQKMTEVAPIAWDTETHRNWLDTNLPLPTLPDGSRVDDSNYKRIAWWKEGWLLVVDRPLGRGFGRQAFGHALKEKYGVKRPQTHAHSGLLNVAIGGGLPAVALWLTFCFMLIRLGFRRFRHDWGFAPLALLLMVIGYLVAGTLDSMIQDNMLQQFLFLAGLFATLTVLGSTGVPRRQLTATAIPTDLSRILVIRRDNIGDLVCTTPFFSALRRRFPRARICALVNSYNLPVLEGNPDVDAVYAYTKTKHRPPGVSPLSVFWQRLRLIMALRRERFDCAIIGGATYLWRGLYLARQTRPRHIVGFTPAQGHPDIDLGVPYTLPYPMHEVEDIFRLLAPLGIDGPPPPPRVTATPDALARVQRALQQRGMERGGIVIGVHVSARRPSNRWPTDRFVALLRELHEKYAARFLLLWSPGSSANPHHPGDDEKAREIAGALPGISLLPYPTDQLGDLIAALAWCDIVVCSDGGAMHIAAALGKPIVCFFGGTEASRWHPWGVPHVVLQPSSRNAADIEVNEALAATHRLLEIRHPGHAGNQRTG